jgi:uncharacterized protein (DUF2236 family)
LKSGEGLRKWAARPGKLNNRMDRFLAVKLKPPAFRRSVRLKWMVSSQYDFGHLECVTFELAFCAGAC